jgi:hypothetical protein
MLFRILLLLAQAHFYLPAQACGFGCAWSSMMHSHSTAHMSPGPTPTASMVKWFALTTSTSFAFPTTTQTSPSNATKFIADNWSLANNKVQGGEDDLTFVPNPYPNTGISVNDTSSSNNGSNNTNSSSTDTVLRVTYPAGSYSRARGGAQFANIWNSSMDLQSVLLSYEVAFDSDFDYVMGGKLPGLRGGPDNDGCDDEKAPNGTDCFSMRTLWGKHGLGEGRIPPPSGCISLIEPYLFNYAVYGYFSTDSGICGDPLVICNPDSSVSLARGSFLFSTREYVILLPFFFAQCGITQ